MSAMDDNERDAFTRQVLERTSGSACARAEELLCDHVDGALDAVSDELVQGHLGNCSPCAALAETLATMNADLPALAHAHPGAAFVEQVLGATRPWRGRLARRWRRFAGDWAQLLRRPRFAWEAAYVGAMLLGLIFGAPASPLRGVPERALTLAQTNPLQALEHTPLAAAPAAVGDWSRSAWAAGGAPIVAWAGRTQDSLAARRQRAAGAAGAVPRHGRELGAACVRLDPGEGALIIGRLGSDMKTIWLQLTAAPQERSQLDTSTAGESHD
jgi:hypothetical protein